MYDVITSCFLNHVTAPVIKLDWASKKSGFFLRCDTEELAEHVKKYFKQSLNDENIKLEIRPILEKFILIIKPNNQAGLFLEAVQAIPAMPNLERGLKSFLKCASGIGLFLKSVQAIPAMRNLERELKGFLKRVSGIGGWRVKINENQEITAWKEYEQQGRADEKTEADSKADSSMRADKLRIIFNKFTGSKIELKKTKDSNHIILIYNLSRRRVFAAIDSFDKLTGILSRITGAAGWQVLIHKRRAYFVYTPELLEKLNLKEEDTKEHSDQVIAKLKDAFSSIETEMTVKRKQPSEGNSGLILIKNINKDDLEKLNSSADATDCRWFSKPADKWRRQALPLKTEI